MLDARRQDGMEFQYQHDPERKPSYNGDPSGGSHYSYDTDFRLVNSTIRNGASITYGNFDTRNMPQTINMPGAGVISMTYDLLTRMTNKSTTYQSTAYQYGETLDASSRVRVLKYQQDAGANNVATYSYDEAGPVLSENHQEDSGNFTVNYSYYADGTAETMTYPSGVTVTETRDTTGRLTGISDNNGNIISATAWQGNEEPQTILLGNAMQIVNTFDARGRVTGSRVTRNGGAVLLHVRYQYDAANNQQVRQFVYRNGKADRFFYDTGERLSEAQIGLTPVAGGSFTLPLADRSYSYHQGGLDYLTSTTFTNLTENIPAFATNWTSHDDFLLPEVVDGFNPVRRSVGQRCGGSSSSPPAGGRWDNPGRGHFDEQR